MTLTWPDTLPNPERNTWQSQPQDARKKRQADTGPTGYGARFSAWSTNVSLSVVLTRDEKAIFDTFYRVDCAAGTRLFYMPDPTTDGWQMLTSDGQPLLMADGTPLLLSARWLCSFGDQVPVESIVGQVQFRKTFNVVVYP